MAFLYCIVRSNLFKDYGNKAIFWVSKNLGLLWLCILLDNEHGVQHRMISVNKFFRIFELIIFCFVVAKCDLMHDVETIFHLSYVLTASGNLF